MKNISSNIISALILALPVLGSCNSDGLDVNRDIRMSANFPSDSDRTKALLESPDIRTSGTIVKVFGYTDGTATDLPGHNPESGEAGSTNLSAGLSLYYNGSSWVYYNAGGTAATGEAYQWISGKTHRFFGWLDKDAKSDLTASGFFGTDYGYTPGTGVLDIPAKAMGISTTNMDFAYSDVVVRSSTGGDFSNVVLPLRHLFASFSLGARNYTSSPITINSVTLKGIYDQRGASVTFGESASSVSYGDGSPMTDQTLVSSSSPVSLSKAESSGDSKVNIVGGASDTPKYFLVWPQEESTVEDAVLVVNYTIGSGEPQNITLHLPYDSEFSDPSRNGWGAGVRRMMELSFHDKQVSIGVYAANWDEKEPVVDYNGSVSVSQPLRIADGYEGNCIAGTNPGEYYFTTTRLPIILEFKFDQPENSTWLVSKNGDFDAFTVVNFDGEGPAEGIIDPASGLSKIVIYPPTGELSKREYRLSLSFAIRKNNGDMENVPDIQMYGAENPVMTFILLK